MVHPSGTIFPIPKSWELKESTTSVQTFNPQPQDIVIPPTPTPSPSPPAPQLSDTEIIKHLQHFAKQPAKSSTFENQKWSIPRALTNSLQTSPWTKVCLFVNGESLCPLDYIPQSDPRNVFEIIDFPSSSIWNIPYNAIPKWLTHIWLSTLHFQKPQAFILPVYRDQWLYEALQHPMLQVVFLKKQLKFRKSLEQRLLGTAPHHSLLLLMGFTGPSLLLNNTHDGILQTPSHINQLVHCVFPSHQPHNILPSLIKQRSNYMLRARQAHEGHAPRRWTL